MKSGDRIGNWILERQLGRGMTASTWLAFPGRNPLPDGSGNPLPPDSADIEGRAVLKILDLRDMGDWSVADLFRREAEALKTLNHPGIPAFIETFESPDGDRLRLVLAMQYMEGETLESLVRSGRRFMEDEVAKILAGIADILAYLTTIRPPVIHRDVNPRNILLGPDNSVSLVDFSGARDAVRSALYPGATLVGTAGYTAVEQVAGKASTRSDLYGAATTAVFLLTGLNPSELPVRNMKIDLGGLVELSPALSCVLDSWLEGDQTKRTLTPADASAILRGEKKPQGKPASGNDVFDILEDRLLRPLIESGNSAKVPRSGTEMNSMRSRLVAALSARADPDLVYADREDGNPRDTPLPTDSRVRVERTDTSLTVTIPPGRHGAASAGLGIFSIAWLSFVAFWTFMTIVMKAPVFFPFFSIPFWLVGITMARATMKSVAGTGVLRLGTEGLSYNEHFFGSGKTRTWPLVDVGSCKIVPAPFQMQGTNRPELLLEAGSASLRIGAGLSERELTAIKQIIDKAKQDFIL